MSRIKRINQYGVSNYDLELDILLIKFLSCMVSAKGEHAEVFKIPTISS